MPGRGLRIFPDKVTPTSPLRNRVQLQINARSLRTDRKVFVRVYDVDDPTPPQFDYAPGDPNALDPNEDAGGDNFGSADEEQGAFSFVTSASVTNTSIVRLAGRQQYAACEVTLDANDQALVEMEVTMQPGDNFRAAVALEPRALLQSSG